MPIYLIIILVILGVAIFGAIVYFSEKQRVETAKENFKNSRTLQNTALQNLLKDADVKAWTIIDVKRKQGQRHRDFASRKDDIDGVAGIYAFFIEDETINLDEYFIPVYIGKTKNIRSRWLQHANKIEKAYWGSCNSEIKYQKIAHYLRLKGKTPSSIRFIVIEKINLIEYNQKCKQREKHWIDASGSGQRGFNSVKA